MKPGIFKRIFTISIVTLVLAMFAVEFYIASALRDDYMATLRDHLNAQAGLIGRNIPFGASANFDNLCQEIKTTAGARVTIIRPDGTVIGDSDSPSASMVNHADRVEVQQALLSGTGMAVRHSDTLNADSLYVAAAISNRGRTTGLVRLSMPLTTVNTAVNALRLKIIIVVGIILVATGSFSLLQVRRIRELTHQIRDFSASLADGELGKRLFLAQGGEFDEIAEGLNAMAAGLQQSTTRREEETRRLSAILRTIPDALLIADDKGVVHLASAAARDFFGEAPLRGKRFAEIVRTSEFLRLVEEVRARRAPGVAEFTIEHPEERRVIARLAPLSYEEGDLSGFVGIFHDITRLTRLERMRTDFVANVSHELKTPIAAVRGFAETLLDGALESRQDAEKFVGIILNHSARLQRLVEDLLTLSRIELGETSFHLRPVDPAELVQNTASLITARAATAGITITAEIAPDLPLVSADPDRITQVLVNLLDNAVKFTPEGGSVRVAARRVDSQQSAVGSQRLSTNDDRLMTDAVEISVEDTGPGIPPMLIPRLGERFYRVDPARSRELGGTGLGLAIVKHILQAHGSTLRIENSPRGGTIVSFCLPVA
jgi:two-component system phosphate regulon sensor histidine kinase PhoR